MKKLDNRKKCLLLVIIILLKFIISILYGQAIFEKKYIYMDGGSREYLLYLPNNKKNNKDLAPLLIVLHGGMGNAEHIAQVTGLTEIAINEGFAVVYPNGNPTIFGKNRRVWNAGSCCGVASRRNINDVLFIENIIDTVSRKNLINKNQVFITGFSNGGMLAYRLACEIPQKITAIMPVAGALVSRYPGKKDIRNVAILHIHGMKDDCIPINGGTSSIGFAKINYIPLSTTLEIFARGRDIENFTEKYRNNGKIIQREYNNNKYAPIRLILIRDWGHSWPNFEEFSASKEIINFAIEIIRINKTMNFTR